MSKTIVRPTLSLGNHIYLYRLLRDAIGCGKQTFMTQVEEALAAGDMAAYDLGSSPRASCSRSSTTALS